MKLLTAIVVSALILGGLRLLSRPGAGGRLGAAIRGSDHQAWQWAVAEKRAELQELLMADPSSQWSAGEKRAELQALLEAEPRL